VLIAAGVDAFVVPSDDPHLSEYSAECYNRREFISGFKGSAGTAVITAAGQALLWTDGRYFLQAEQELGPGWTLMRSGEPGVPTLTAWLAEHTPAGGSVGVDPLVHSATFATELSAALQKKGIALKPLDPTLPNPVDTVWGAARPAAPDAPLRVHPLRYAATSDMSVYVSIVVMHSSEADAAVTAAALHQAYSSYVLLLVAVASDSAVVVVIFSLYK
jgi:Xaa-Pro aminopeptidase